MEWKSTLWTVIRDARQGDDAALRRFVERYRPPVVAFCVRRGLASEAEDLAQDVFLQLFDGGALERADPRQGRFRSLLLAVTRHVIGHHFEKTRALKRGGATRTVPLGELDPAAPAPDDEFDREWVAHLIGLALGRLAESNPSYHEALRRFLLDGQSYAQITAETGRSATELKNQIYRGKQKLIGYLRELVRDYAGSHAEAAEELQLLSRFFGEES